MCKRPITKRRPLLECLEEKQLPSTVASTPPLENETSPDQLPVSNPDDAAAFDQDIVDEVDTDAVLYTQAGSSKGRSAKSQGNRTISPAAKKPLFGFLVYRITNPNRFNNRIKPPFTHVLVQSRQPIPGQVYNVLYVVVRNGTARTFDASNNLQVRFPGQHDSVPILTGDKQWKPGEWFIFYVLTKKYYPMPNVVSSGFEFNLGGARSVAIPGPSGIFLRITYNPAKFDRTLDWIVRNSPGVPGGPRGIRLGLPNTAMYEFLSAKTDRPDFGGYF